MLKISYVPERLLVGLIDEHVAAVGIEAHLGVAVVVHLDELVECVRLQLPGRVSAGQQHSIKYRGRVQSEHNVLLYTAYVYKRVV